MRKVAGVSGNGTVVLDCGHVRSSRRGHQGGGWTPVTDVEEMTCDACYEDAAEVLANYRIMRGQRGRYGTHTRAR